MNPSLQNYVSGPALVIDPNKPDSGPRLHCGGGGEPNPFPVKDPNEPDSAHVCMVAEETNRSMVDGNMGAFE